MRCSHYTLSCNLYNSSGDFFRRPEKQLRICITGAGGFIASHLAKRLKSEGHYIVACDWKRNEHMEVSI